MRRWIWSSTAIVVCVALVGIFVTSHNATTGAGTTPVEMYVEYVPPLMAPGGGSLLVAGNIPADCSTWHELYPNFCLNHHQDAYGDNGDGVVSPCDGIKLDGACYHITAVGPTYWTTCYPPDGSPPYTVVFEPVDPAGGNPVCQTWHQIYPDFCGTIHVDSFHDSDNNNEVTPCDEIDVITTPGAAPTYYHIDRVELDITIVPGPTPVEQSTWGRIKSFFNGIIH